MSELDPGLAQQINDILKDSPLSKPRTTDIQPNLALKFPDLPVGACVYVVGRCDHKSGRTVWFSGAIQGEFDLSNREQFKTIWHDAAKFAERESLAHNPDDPITDFAVVYTQQFKA